jgi:hypothetical protein
MRGCKNQTELKFHISVLYLKHKLKKIGRFKNSSRGGQQGAQEILILDLIKNHTTQSFNISF